MKIFRTLERAKEKKLSDLQAAYFLCSAIYRQFTGRRLPVGEFIERQREIEHMDATEEPRE